MVMHAREEIYRVAVRLSLNVLVVSNGSRPVRPPGTSKVRMVLVGQKRRRGRQLDCRAYLGR